MLEPITSPRVLGVGRLPGGLANAQHNFSMRASSPVRYLLRSPVQPVTTNGYPMQPVKTNGYPMQPVNTNGYPVQPVKTDGYIRPASPHLIQTRRIPVDSQSTPRLHPGQVHSRSQEPLTVMHPVPVPSPAASPGRGATSPFRVFRAAPADPNDCLVKQLKALQEAKDLAAAQQAESEQMIAKRQDQLRRETYKALYASGLSDALRRWPPPSLSPLRGAGELLEPEPPLGSSLEEVQERRDSLAKQLRALQAAKVAISAKQAESDHMVLQHQEPFPALSAHNLGDLLRQCGAPAGQHPDGETPRSPRQDSTGVEESAAEQELPSETTASRPSLPAHERAKQVSRASKDVPKSQSLTRSSRGRRPSSPFLSAEEARRCTAELAALARNVSAKELRELRMLKRPPQAVANLLEALSITLGDKDLRPASFRKLLSDSLPQRLGAVDVASLSSARAAKLRSLLGSPDASVEAVSRICRPCASLAEWCGCLNSCLSRDQDHPDLGSREQQTVSTQRSQSDSGTPRPAVDQSYLIVEPDLSQMSRDELAEVWELTVTKPDIGTVVFHGTTDCRDLDIAETVVLKRGYVLVYPDPAKKPPPGEGLNKHATVTMYQCFPPGGHVKDEEALAEYKVKIKEMTEEKSTCRFIDYDCLTGVWKFEVERF